MDPRLGEVGDRVVGSGRAELAAAMGPAPVVRGRVLLQDGPRMPLAEDQHPVGDLGPSGEHEPFRIRVRSRAAGWDLHGLDPGLGQDPNPDPDELTVSPTKGAGRHRERRPLARWLHEAD
jgi:hypothetical protein